MNTNQTPAGFTRPEELPDSVDVIGVSFRDSGKIYYFASCGVTAGEGTGVVVETARGVEYGKVTLANRPVPKTELVLPLKKVLRAATGDDLAHLEENRRKEDEAFRVCREKIREHGLDMKLIEAEYTFDNAKLLFYFTSEKRVDFRELVKDLAGIFHTRIELRQIGIRDETKLMGGLGVCYMECCCHSFLDDFTQVSIKMAKEQGLSLNGAKISGACGRLMCCLRYEQETYQEESRRTPKVGAQLVTPDGTGVVVDAKPLLALVKVRLDADPDGAPRVYDRDLVRPKTDQDETTPRGGKIDHPAKPAFVPFTPLSGGTEEDVETPSGESRKTHGGKDRDRRKGEKKPQGTAAGNPKGGNPERAKGGSGGSGGTDGTDGKGKPAGKGGRPGQSPKGAVSVQVQEQGQGQGQGKNPGRSGAARAGERSRYVQPPEEAGEPALRADLTEPYREDGDGRDGREGGRRNRGKKSHTERKAENPAKKSENPEKND